MKCCETPATAKPPGGHISGTDLKQVFHNIIECPAQEGVHPHVRLEIVAGYLIDAHSGVVIGPAPSLDPAISMDQIPNCAFRDTLGAGGHNFDNLCSNLQDAGAETVDFLSSYVEDASNLPPANYHAQPKAYRHSKNADRRHHAPLPLDQCTKRGTPWFETRSFMGYPVSKRVISPAERAEIIAAAEYSLDRKTPLNLHVALKPPSDHMTPVERMSMWPVYRQKWRNFARNHGFEKDCLMVAVRESDPITNAGEHEHWLIYAPPRLHDDAIRLVSGWCENAFIEPVDIRGRSIAGKVKSIVGYLLKSAAPQDTWKDPTIVYRRSGAVLGRRTFVTMNMRAKALAKAEPLVKAARRIRKERDTVKQMIEGARLRSSSIDHREWCLAYSIQSQ